MSRSLADQTPGLTEMRDPRGVRERAGGKPVAVLEGARVVDCFALVEAVVEPAAMRHAIVPEAMASLDRRRAVNQPVLDWLKDK